MTTLPLVLIHGYSDSAKGFKRWRDVISERLGIDRSRIHQISYVSLANEVSIRDIAEGLDFALTKEAKLESDEPFDAIVHSTGMLIIRAWLARYASMERPRRLRHLVALAPATNGSPIAHKGRSWLGALVKGNRDPGPDFLEAGDQVLTSLELASRFTWDLAEKDMFGEGNTARFKKGAGSPFVFTLCGDSGYGQVSDAATRLAGAKIDGSDGVVRWAGAALNSRRLLVDYTDPVQVATSTIGANRIHPRITVSKWSNQDNILILWPKLNHSTIMQPKTDCALAEIVSEALKVKTDKDYVAWNKKAIEAAKAERQDDGKPTPLWQQFIMRVVDERGEGVADWTAEFIMSKKGDDKPQPVVIDDFHPYEKDKSYRCLHVDLNKNTLGSAGDLKNIASFSMNLYMNTNSRYVVYLAKHSDNAAFSSNSHTGFSELEVDLSEWFKSDNKEFCLPMPFTTTFIEIRVNRDPAILDEKAKVCYLDTSS